jgi:biopolymer transport protein ExbD
MAVSTSGSEPIVSINVTPFVDVVLVLLIIFMATSNYLVTPAIEVQLPKAASATDAELQPLSVVLSRDGLLFVNGDPTDRLRLAERCRQALAVDPSASVMLAADGRVQHADVVAVIDLLRKNGVVNFALNVEAPDAVRVAAP